MMKRYISAMKWTMLGSGILLAAFGILTLFLPGQNVLWLGVLISVIVLVSGISEMAAFFRERKEERSGWMLAESILMILLGIWMVFGSGSWVLTAILPYLFAVLLFAIGIVRIVESLELRSYGSRRWGWMLAFGIVLVILGGLLFFAPLLSAALISTLISMMLIGYGISNITVFVNIQRTGSYIRKRVKRFKERMQFE